MKYFIGIIVILIGMLMVIKSEWFLKAFGYSAFAESKFRIWGGSRMFYKFLGIVLIIGALMLMTGWLQQILISLFTFG